MIFILSSALGVTIALLIISAAINASKSSKIRRLEWELRAARDATKMQVDFVESCKTDVKHIRDAVHDRNVMVLAHMSEIRDAAESVLEMVDAIERGHESIPQKS